MAKAKQMDHLITAMYMIGVINMGSATNKITRNAHAKNYIQAVFAERLLAEGFVCPDDKMLYWYRIVNKELVQSVCFFSRWSNVPIMMEIAYGLHPLFVPPFYSSDVHISIPGHDERFNPLTIKEAPPSRHFAPYSDEASVYAPREDGRGLYTLEQILLPQINGVQTMEQCYRFHLDKAQELNSGFSPTIIDEAIYLNDTAAFPKCQVAINRLLRNYERLCAQYPTIKNYKDTLSQLQLQNRALSENAREEFLLSLEQRKQKNIKWLNKKLGMTL